jgi:glycosyltransferase
VASVAQQVYVDVEHLIIDGASTDGTVDLLLDLQKADGYSESFKLLSESDSGIYDALNKGLALSTGDVVGFLHADDFYADTHVLESIARAFDDPSICGVYGDLQYVTDDNNLEVVRNWKSSPFNKRQLSWGWMPPHPTLYVRKEWYKAIGGFDTRYRISADYFSILSLFSNPDFKTVYLPKVMVKMRVGGISNKSVKTIFKKSREDLIALQRSRVGGWGALFWKNLSKLGQF